MGQDAGVDVDGGKGGEWGALLALPAAAREPEQIDELMQAAMQARPDEVKRLLATCDPMAADVDGFTALMRASRAGCARSVELLLPVSNPLAKNKMGSTALMEAAKWGTQACCALLVPHGGVDELSANGRSALDGAIERLAFGSALLIGAQISRIESGPGGVSPLMLAAVALTLASAERSGGGSKAQEAEAERARALIAILAAKPGADGVDKRGRDALMRSAWAGHGIAVEALLPWIAPGRVDDKGLDAAALARRAGYVELAARIEAHEIGAHASIAERSARPRSL